MTIPLLLSPVISELGRSGLGTSAGCRILLDPTCLLEVLIRKPAEVVTRTEYILQRSGFKFRKEFRVLAGKWTMQALLPFPMVCKKYTVEPCLVGTPEKRHLDCVDTNRCLDDMSYTERVGSLIPASQQG